MYFRFISYRPPRLPHILRKRMISNTARYVSRFDFYKGCGFCVLVHAYHTKKETERSLYGAQKKVSDDKIGVASNGVRGRDNLRNSPERGSGGGGAATTNTSSTHRVTIPPKKSNARGTSSPDRSMTESESEILICVYLGKNQQYYFGGLS
jgi:hypothetical protein